MKKHITFQTLSLSPSDHESEEGHCSLLVNLLPEDGALHPILPTREEMAEIPSDSRLVATHRPHGRLHLIIESSRGDGTFDYHWQEAPSPGSTLSDACRMVLATNISHANAFADMGDTLCLALDDDTLLAVWQEGEGRYVTLGHTDLLYDITLTQDRQTLIHTTLPITPALANHLDHAGNVLTSTPALPSHVFGDWPTGGDRHVTGATMVAAQMECALDQQLSQLGAGAMKHVCLGIAALRLPGGHHLMCSNLFALMPAGLPTTIEADREHNMLSMEAWCHRHTITVTMRSQHALSSGLVEGVDIFLTRPLRFLDLRQPSDITTNGAGHTTQLTFAHLGRSATLQALDDAPFHHSMTIHPEEMGTPLVVQNIDSSSTPLDLTHLHRDAMGAQWAIAHNNRLTLATTRPVLHSPLEIGIRYRYNTLDVATRQALGTDEAEDALASELMAGIRPDIADQAEGATATLLVRGITSDPVACEMWWQAEVQYPLPGLIMHPGYHLKELEYHLRLTEGGQTRYYATRQPLESLTRKGLSAAVFTDSGLAHGTHRPYFLSLLLQQTRDLTYDPTLHTYEESHLSWKEETAEDFEQHLSKVRNAWPLSTENTILRTSEPGMPLLPAHQATASIGQGMLQGIINNTRRSADGLYGDGQFYAFTDSGVWLLRFSNGRWNAQQSVTRSPMRRQGQMVATSDAVAFISLRGLMLLKGSTCSCLSDPLRGHNTTLHQLPHIGEALATEPPLGTLPHPHPDWTGSFMDDAQLAYDAATERLFLFTDHDTPMLAYSLRSGGWAMVTHAPHAILQDGNDTWWTDLHERCNKVSRLQQRVGQRQPVALVTRPLSLGLRHIAKTVERMLVRGLFCHQGVAGSHVGVVLYGSNDLIQWHLIGSSTHQYLRRRRGTPFRWFRVMAVGSISPGETLEGVSFVFQRR
ncbi:MAG: hypothetical protein IKH88_06870 [Prevotella sp.]|nr:hypothetical protein [Prevotella sp.]